MKTTVVEKSLDDKEVKICGLLKRGHSSKEIASIANMTKPAVDSRINVLIKHFGVKNRIELVANLIADGII
jgi:DNA-binding NarL/FixJ family response regulator